MILTLTSKIALLDSPETASHMFAQALDILTWLRLTSKCSLNSACALLWRRDSCLSRPKAATKRTSWLMWRIPKIAMHPRGMYACGHCGPCWLGMLVCFGRYVHADGWCCKVRLYVHLSRSARISLHPRFFSFVNRCYSAGSSSCISSDQSVVSQDNTAELPGQISGTNSSVVPPLSSESLLSACNAGNFSRFFRPFLPVSACWSRGLEKYHVQCTAYSYKLRKLYCVFCTR